MAAGSSKPVVYYTFENGTGTTVTDRSNAGNNLDGTLSDDGMWNTDSAGGTYSLEFDADADLVTISKNALTDFDYDDAFSVSLWCKIGMHYGWKVLFGNEEGASAYQGYIIATNNSAVNWMLQNTWNTDTHQIGRTGWTDIRNAGWTHVVCTYNGNGANDGLEIYINGVAENVTHGSYGVYPPAASTLIDTIVTTTDLRIGQGFGTGYHWTGGFIDEFSVWDVELSSADVTTIYNSGTPLDVSNGLVAAGLPSAIKKLGVVASADVKKLLTTPAASIKKVIGRG